ncbi:MAG: hypothetical protein ACAH11_00290 [Sphingomonas sp.]
MRRALPFAALLLALAPMQAAAQPTPRLIPVKVEPYQFPIMLAFTDCMERTVDRVPRDPGVEDRLLAEATGPCRTAVLARIDSGELRRDGQKLTSSQRRDSIRVMDQTAANLRTSRRFYGLPQVDPNGPIARGVRVPDPLASHFQRYSACVNGGLKAPPAMNPARVERAIKACAALRGQLAVDADGVLARQPDYADPAKRQAAIAEMFDGFDAMMRAIGRGEGFLPPPGQTTK